MLLQHTCSHVHSYTCFRLTRVHGSWPMVPLDGINGMVSAPLNLCASMYRAWIPGDWILRAAVKLRCVFVGPVHDCYTVKPANTQLQNTNITTLNNNKRKHAATKKNLNIIEPKKIIKSLVDARQHHQSTGVKKRQFASTRVNSQHMISNAPRTKKYIDKC